MPFIRQIEAYCNEPGGSSFDGNFRLVRRLGQGGQGVADLYTNQRTGESRVFKTIQHSSRDVPREVRKMEIITHTFPNSKNFLLMLDNKRDWQQPGTWTIVYPYYPAGDLRQYVRKRYPSRLVSERFIWNIYAQLANAVANLHSSARLIHCDLKPENVLVDDSGDGYPTAVIADFGLARASVPHGLLAVGTMEFHPPENSPSRKFDSWGVGAIAHWLATGLAPVDPKTRIWPPLGIRTAREELKFLDPHGTREQHVMILNKQKYLHPRKKHNIAAIGYSQSLHNMIHLNLEWDPHERMDTVTLYNRVAQYAGRSRSHRMPHHGILRRATAGWQWFI